MSTIIVNIDGTIADCRHRRHFVTDDKQDWNSFFNAMKKDLPIKPTAELVRRLNQHHDIYLVTARPESYRSMTNSWLVQYEIPFEYLFMREDDYKDKDGNQGKPWEYKEEVLRHLKRSGTEILLAIDDKEECVGMWRRNGVLCLQNSMKDMP
jgi:hypothetical protein